MSEEERQVDEAITNIAIAAYITWSDFVDALLKEGMVTYTMEGWVAYLAEEMERFIAWDDAIVEETIKCVRSPQQ